MLHQVRLEQFLNISDPLLSRPADLHWFFRVGEQLARGEAPEVAVEAIRMERMTAFQKPGGARHVVEQQGGRRA